MLETPQIPELINELKLYGHKPSPSGNVQYGAPEGYHDDCVTALALAAWQLKRSPPLGKILAGFGKPPEFLQELSYLNHPFFQ